ncbi:MAG: hypothetical protein AB1391_01335 [Candidatus Micrarchaeota archaeon]
MISSYAELRGFSEKEMFALVQDKILCYFSAKRDKENASINNCCFGSSSSKTILSSFSRSR